MASKTVSFKSSPMDEEFRRIMYELISKAEKEILVVTGEAGAFKNYQDMRWAMEAAAKRGVKIKVYARSPEQVMINKMISAGLEVYLGEEVPRDHYTVVDKETIVTSFAHEPHKTGVRQGTVVTDKKKANQKVLEFKKLQKKAKKAKIDPNIDPLLKVLKNPLHLGFEIDSSKIDTTLN